MIPDKWCKAGKPADVDFFRFFFYTALILTFINRPPAAFGFVPPEFYFPQFIFSLLHLPQPGPNIWIVILLWKFSLTTSAIGFMTRVSNVMSFVLGFYLLGLSWSMGNQHHKYLLLILILGVFAFSRSGQFISVDRWLTKRKFFQSRAVTDERWVLRFCQFLWCLQYFGSGLTKVITSGAAYFVSGSVQKMFLFAQWVYLPDGFEMVNLKGQWIVEHPWLCNALASAGLILELSAPLAILKRAWRWLPILGIAIMHFGVYTTMSLWYFEVLPAFLVWIPWTDLFARFGWFVGADEI